MKAKDLMTRSWVMLGGKKMLRCYGANTHTNDVFLENGVVTNVSELTPIPLTEDILEKNGFIRLYGQYALPVAIGKDDGVCIFPHLADYPNNNGAMLVNIKHLYTEAKIAITYVHELQQALRLCGIEKEIII